MRVSGVKGYNINFQRKLTKPEQSDLRENSNKAFDIMGTQERAVITHGSCFPAGSRDTYIGSPYGSAAKNYIEFLSVFGFNNNQLGPGGELQKGSTSPYNASAFAQNRLFIDLEELTDDKYGNLLSQKTYEDITSEPAVNDKNYTMTDFSKAEEVYDTALKEIYQNFIDKLSKKQPQAVALNKEFEAFLNNNDERLTEEGIFKVLAKKYCTDDYTKWEDLLDRTLITDIKKGDIQAEFRFNKIYNDNFDEVEQYKFEQFILTKQIKEHKSWRDEKNFKYINDLLVGCSKMDAWRYEDIFLDDWEMGAYEGTRVSQRWHIPVIDPKKIFLNADYDLNAGGKFLKEKIDSALEFSENIRVDHVMGLVEPYLLAKYAKDEDFVSNPSYVKNKDYELYISELKDPENPECLYDFYWDYTKLIEHLVLPVFKSHGLDKNTVVWEDICSWPSRYKQVYKEQQLPGLSNLDWEGAETAVKNSPNNWFLLGNHDSPPVMNYLRRTAKLNDGRNVEYTRNQMAWFPEKLAYYLNMDDTRENIKSIRSNLADLYKKDDKAIVMAKFAQLLTTPKFQISFDDLLGITDVIYNSPGTKNETNWKARISADYIDKYYSNLSSDHPTALNIPELLSQALQAKIDMEVKAHNYDEGFKSEIYAKSQPVLEKLQYYSKVLKEKEN